jgi:hypothetical protein
MATFNFSVQVDLNFYVQAGDRGKAFSEAETKLNALGCTPTLHEVLAELGVLTLLYLPMETDHGSIPTLDLDTPERS